jgi:cyclic-di-GMP-binding protein
MAISAPQASSLFFFDARSCKEWLKAIPLTNIHQAQQKLLDALRMLNADSRFLPVERLTSMELMRDKLSFLLNEQRSRYAGKTYPLSNTDMAGWQISNQLLSEMETGYRRCYQDASEVDAILAPHSALIIQRMIRYIGLGMLMAGFIYRKFDPTVWMRLHLQWIEAESRSLTQTRVKDSIGTADGYSSVEQAYIAVLLGQLAAITQLTSREIDFTDIVLRRFSHKVTLSTPDASQLADGSSLAVDLFASRGAEFQSVFNDAAHVRVLNVADLSKSLRRRIRKLAAGETALSLELPSDWSAADAEIQLTRLHKLWCEPAGNQVMATIPAEHNAIVAFGIAETHFFLSGDLFEQPDVKRIMSRQETNDIAMFGRVSESTIRSRYSEFNYGSETWVVVDESRGRLRLIRPSNSSRGLAIGLLLGVRVANTVDSQTSNNDFYLGVVSELMEDAPNQYTVTLSMLPGKPEAIAVRSADNKARISTYTQGFRLSQMASLNIPETLVVPSNFAAVGRGIDIFHQAHGTAKEVKVLSIIEHSADFDRVTIAG